MTIFSYHLLETSFSKAISLLLFPPKAKQTAGLIHAECMNAMTLGSPIFSLERILVKRIAFFAQWENEAALEKFLAQDKKGKILNEGWHCRLLYARQWGNISGFEIPTKAQVETLDTDPVVAITLARMQLLQIPRFIRWGRPVEKLVRDHPSATLSNASIRFPRTVSTFSVWTTQKDMIGMVSGHNKVEHPTRHREAMKERNRKDFHIEFTTLRFKSIGEYGQWLNKTNYIPHLL